MHLENLCTRVLRVNARVRNDCKMVKIMKLKRYFSAVVLVLLCICLLPSCKSEDNEIVPDEHCFISSFALNSLKRVIYTQNDNGEDSTYTVTFDASAFPFSIDQRNLVIENLDSFPHGTRVSAVLASINYKGILTYKQRGATEWSLYSEKDSIDFSSPVEFAVFSNTGNSERHYKIKVNVHKLDGTKCTWMNTGESLELNQIQERKIVSVSDRLVLLGRNADGDLLVATRSADLRDMWSVDVVSGAEGADIQTLKSASDGTLMMSTTDGALLQSADGKSWQTVSEAVPGRVLAGLSQACIYVIADGKLQSSIDGGQTWSDEAIDAAASHLPNSQLNVIQCQQSNGQHRLVLAGCNSTSADDKVEVWSKSWKQSGKEGDALWMYYPHTSDNRYLCPEFSPLVMLPYYNGLIAFGGKTSDGKTNALSQMLYSPDFGLTWKTNTELYLPSELKGKDAPMTATVDKDDFIWVVVGNQTWRGRQNKLGF